MRANLQTFPKYEVISDEHSNDSYFISKIQCWKADFEAELREKLKISKKCPIGFRHRTDYQIGQTELIKEILGDDAV